MKTLRTFALAAALALAAGMAYAGDHDACEVAKKVFAEARVEYDANTQQPTELLYAMTDAGYAQYHACVDEGAVRNCQVYHYGVIACLSVDYGCGREPYSECHGCCEYYFRDINPDRSHCYKKVEFWDTKKYLNDACAQVRLEVQEEQEAMSVDYYR